MADLTALTAIYQTHIDAITDDLTKEKAQVALSAWSAAETQYQSILAAEATGYTVTGRTITKRDIDAARRARDAAAADLEGLLGVGDAGVSLVNMGGRIL